MVCGTGHEEVFLAKRISTPHDVRVSGPIAQKLDQARMRGALWEGIQPERPGKPGDTEIVGPVGIHTPPLPLLLLPHCNDMALHVGDDDWGQSVDAPLALIKA